MGVTIRTCLYLHGQSPFDNRVYVQRKVTRASFGAKPAYGGKSCDERNWPGERPWRWPSIRLLGASD